MNAFSSLLVLSLVLEPTCLMASSRLDEDFYRAFSRRTVASQIAASQISHKHASRLLYSRMFPLFQEWGFRRRALWFFPWVRRSWNFSYAAWMTNNPMWRQGNFFLRRARLFGFSNMYEERETWASPFPRQFYPFRRKFHNLGFPGFERNSPPPYAVASYQIPIQPAPIYQQVPGVVPVNTTLSLGMPITPMSSVIKKTPKILESPIPSDDEDDSSYYSSTDEESLEEEDPSEGERIIISKPNPSSSSKVKGDENQEPNLNQAHSLFTQVTSETPLKKESWRRLCARPKFKEVCALRKEFQENTTSYFENMNNLDAKVISLCKGGGYKYAAVNVLNEDDIVFYLDKDLDQSCWQRKFFDNTGELQDVNADKLLPEDQDCPITGVLYTFTDEKEQPLRPSKKSKKVSAPQEMVKEVLKVCIIKNPQYVLVVWLESQAKRLAFELERKLSKNEKKTQLSLGSSMGSELFQARMQDFDNPTNHEQSRAALEFLDELKKRGPALNRKKNPHKNKRATPVHEIDFEGAKPFDFENEPPSKPLVSLFESLDREDMRELEEGFKKETGASFKDLLALVDNSSENLSKEETESMRYAVDFTSQKLGRFGSLNINLSSNRLKNSSSLPGQDAPSQPLKSTPFPLSSLKKAGHSLPAKSWKGDRATKKGTCKSQQYLTESTNSEKWQGNLSIQSME